MNVNKVFCLFEQSGTFKNVFKGFGIEAEDYDILNDFGETDHITDLFAEIDRAYEGKPSIFDKVSKDDLCIAFFPCTRFECQAPLLFRGENSRQNGWSDVQKLEYSMNLHNELHDLYICGGGGGIEPMLRTIIETTRLTLHPVSELLSQQLSTEEPWTYLRAIGGVSEGIKGGLA